MASADIDTTHFSGLVGQLYEAVLNPATLQPAMVALSRWLGVDACHLIGWDTARFVPRLAVLDDQAADHVDPDYVQHYSHIDPRRERLAQVPMGQLATCGQFFDEGYVSRSEFYQRYLIPRGRRHTMGAHLYRDEHVDFYVSFYHGVGRATFSSTQIDQARLLVPHLQRIARLMLRHETLGAAAHRGEAGLDALDQGVLVLGPQGELLRTNRRGQALLREGRWFTVQAGRLRLPAPASPSLLEDMLARVCHSGVPECRLLRASGHAPGLLEDEPWCGLTVLRLPVAEPGAPGAPVLHPRATTLLLLSVPDAQRSVSGEQLAQMFGLTRAEARLAEALVRGQSVDDYARGQDLALATVRSQVRAVLDKTQATRQQDLVRLLARLPSARPPVGH